MWTGDSSHVKKINFPSPVIILLLFILMQKHYCDHPAKLQLEGDWLKCPPTQNRLDDTAKPRRCNRATTSPCLATCTLWLTLMSLALNIAHRKSSIYINMVLCVADFNIHHFSHKVMALVLFYLWSHFRHLCSSPSAK